LFRATPSGIVVSLVALAVGWCRRFSRVGWCRWGRWGRVVPLGSLKRSSAAAASLRPLVPLPLGRLGRLKSAEFVKNPLDSLVPPGCSQSSKALPAPCALRHPRKRKSAH